MAKTGVLRMRVTEGEKAAFEEAAKIAGASFSTWARLALRRAAIREFQDAGRRVDFNRPELGDARHNETIRPHVVKIETPSGWGSGFLTLYNHDKSWVGIATAAHVVSHADEWQQPIRLTHAGSGATLFLKSEERVIFLDRATDSAILLLFKRELQLPECPIALLPMEQPCPIGLDIGWLGFPAIEPDTLCFFAGTVSARQTNRKAYLIDGVAINGVSGGPVFHSPTPDEVQIIGCVSAYHANRATGETLPGLLRAQDVSHFHGVAEYIHTIDEANAKKREVEAAQAQAAQEEGAGAAEAPAAIAEAASN